MKDLIFINGPMGAGKTAVSQELKRLLPGSVFLDGDWCWDMHPFTVTDETKQMVLNNIAALLGNFIACSAFETVIFCWVMHEYHIMEEIESRLNLSDCRVSRFTVTCSAETLRGRLEKDIAAGIRQPDILERSSARLPLYLQEDMKTVKIQTDHYTVRQVAKELANKISQARCSEK